MSIFEFDRYINGVLMAEGVTIERADTLTEAMQKAASIAPRGPNRETPVLILRAAAKVRANSEGDGEVEPAFWPPIVELGRVLGAFADALKHHHHWTAIRQADYDKANLALQALASIPATGGEK